jgi:hypothetical protein
MRILAMLGGGLATFVLVFLLALYLHFPGQAAADRLSWQVQESSGGKWLIQAADARIWRGAGLALQDVVLFKREVSRKRSPEGEAAAAVPVLRVDELALRAPPSSTAATSTASSGRATRGACCAWTAPTSI